MYVEIVYHRGHSCEHSPDRECTPCFHAGLVSYLGSKDAANDLWDRRVAKGPKDGVESITVFEDGADFDENTSVIFTSR